MPSFWKTRPFWALALGLFINAFVYGVAAVALNWIPHRGWIPTVLLLWSPLVLSLGIVCGGWLADRLGRRALLLGGPWGYIGGAMVLLAGPGLFSALIGSGLLIMTAGLESNTILTYSQELMPEGTKRPAMYAELNFVNLGGLALAALAFFSHRWGTIMLRRSTALLPIALALLSLWLRLPLRESSLWELSQRRLERVGVPVDHGLRVAVAIIFSFSNTAGFSLLTYALGIEFLPQHFHHLLLVSTTTSFLTGLAARWLGQVSARVILLAGYGMAFASALALVYIERPGHPGFWPVLFILSAFTSMSYLAEDTFKSDEWPSGIRSRMIAVVRVGGLLAYALLLLASQGAPVKHFLVIIAGVWGLGFLASVIWLLAHLPFFKNQNAVSIVRICDRLRRTKLR